MAKVQRATALLLAILFLATSLGFTFVVVWQIYNDQTSAPATPHSSNNQTGDQVPDNTNDNALKGTKLEGFEPIATVNELKTIDVKQGDGAAVTGADTIVAHYTGALAKDGTIFESSKDAGQPATFPLSGLIQGWQEGIPGMKVGGTRRLIIPASLAYGEQGSPPAIGPNEPLIFDIELISIE